MFVHTIEVTFMRKRKPADYEGVDASVSLGATLSEGEDHLACTQSLMDDAASVVYTRLGMKEASQRVFTEKQPAAQTTPNRTEGVNGPTSAPSAATKSADKPAETKAEDKPVSPSPAAVQGEPEKRKPGRPKKETTEAAPQIRTNPENRVDPNAGPDIPEEAVQPKATPAPKAAPAAQPDIPEDEPSAAADGAVSEITAQELHQFVVDHLSVKKSFTGNDVKQALVKVSGFERMSDIADGKVRLKVKQHLEALIAAKKAG